MGGIFDASGDRAHDGRIDSADYTNLWNEMREKISLVSAGKPTPGQGSFGHIAGGYDAGEYIHIWLLSRLVLTAHLTGYYG